MPHDAAKQNDHVIATDTHLVSGAPTPVPFDGLLDGSLSPNVLVENLFAATVDSTATNTPAHVPPPGKTFDKPPMNRATVVAGSGTVLINNLPAARDGDAADTCNDPADAPVGKISATSTVKVGG